MGKPEGVKVVRVDGTELECELVHRGPDDKGLDVWEVTGVVFREGDKIQCKVLPAKTSLVVTARP